MKYKHDLNLPDWGPYSKRYAGISHIANKQDGIRFDLSVFPAIYRRKVDIPNVMFESGYHSWQAASDLSYFSTRHELEWKDKLYCDVSYSQIDDSAYVFGAEFVNNSDVSQNTTLHCMANINYAWESEKSGDRIKPLISYKLGDSAYVIKATDYITYNKNWTIPKENLITDAMRLGETRRAGFIHGSGINIGRSEGDSLSFSLKDKPSDCISIRLKNISDLNAKLILSGAVQTEVEIDDSQEIKQYFINNIKIDPTKELIIRSDVQIILDSIVLYSSEDEVVPEAIETMPDHTAEKIEDGNTLILKYRDSEYYYGLCWKYDDFVVRQINTDYLDSFLRVMTQEHVSKVLGHNKKGEYANVFIRPIFLDPHTSKQIFGAVCCGKTVDEVKEKLHKYLNDTDFCDIYNSRKAALKKNPITDDGKKYSFSQEKMVSTTLTNIVYPIYSQGNYIRHYTPGKWWDSLYTWDSGFVGLGLAECDVERAKDCLYAYLTDPGDKDCAFIHHGTPVPVQFYLFSRIFSLTNDIEFAKDCYPRLKQYYEFMAGHLGSSVTDSRKSHLLYTWDYFYNSGGWDDYPAQVYTHKKRLENIVSPVATTAHVIRCAKILQLIGDIIQLDKSELEEYQKDIDTFTKSLNDYAYDKETGYFSYVLHDKDGYPKEFLRTESGENFNKGLDGLTPMISGILDDTQTKRAVDKLMNPKEIWTRIGLSTVDQSASYYSKDGYWNGAVWMPHQWFFYKALLDYGYADEAYKIAQTALEVWKNEVDESYDCFEHFIISSGRGAGWHCFSGLSTPVLCWFKNYYCKGNIMCGSSGMVTKKSCNDDLSELDFELIYSDNWDKTTVIVVLEPKYEYSICVDGQEVPYRKRTDGAYEIDIKTKKLERVSVNCKRR